MKKVLFILKKRSLYSDSSYSTLNSGLHNSATFVKDMLAENNIESTLVNVVDNNEIDRYVTLYKPDIVIIEALWVTPSKFEILNKLHPNVTWVIRLHSELPFLANEGIAITWLKEYVKYDRVKISSNSKYLCKSLEQYLKTDIIYTPNYYPVKCWEEPFTTCEDGDVINIGLFGAIRPFKNSLTQAMAAINYADKHGKVLKLHINSVRIEQKADNVYKNLKALFIDTKHELIEYGWLDHKDFLELVSTMDICMQVSFTETYNIVSADSINVNVPVVTSDEITFVNYFSRSGSTKNTNEIIKRLEFSLRYKGIVTLVNNLLLKWDSYKAKKTWIKFIKNM